MSGKPALAAVPEREAPAPARQRPIRLFVVDDHRVVREALCAVLAREPDLEVSGEASSAEEAVDLLAEAAPDVILIDYSLPGMSGIDLCREIAERRLPGEVVMLTGYLEEELARLAILSGARAYIVKDVDAEGLKHAIRVVATGQTVIDAEVGRRMLTWAWRPELQGQDAIEALTPAERDALRLLASGEPDRMIALFTGLTRDEVAALLKRLYRKLGVRSRSEATAMAARHHGRA